MDSDDELYFDNDDDDEVVMPRVAPKGRLLRLDVLW